MSMPASSKMRCTAPMVSQSSSLSAWRTGYQRVRPRLTTSTRQAPSGVILIALFQLSDRDDAVQGYSRRKEGPGGQQGAHQGLSLGRNASDCCDGGRAGIDRHFGGHQPGQRGIYPAGGEVADSPE
jgi:hypothetical protein